MIWFGVSIILLCCALISADSSSSSSSSSSSESHEKHKHRGPSRHSILHLNPSVPDNHIIHRYNHPAYPFPVHNRVYEQGHPGYGYHGLPYGQYPPPPPGYQYLPGYHQLPGYQQPPHGFQHPPASWLPTTAINLPIGYYPPQPPSPSSSSSATSAINQQPAPVTPSQGHKSNPSSSSSSNSSVTINQGTGSIPTEAPYPADWHNPNHGHRPLKEKSPGEYIYTLSDPDFKVRSNQPACGDNAVCN